MAAPDYFARKPSYNRARPGLAGLTTPGSPHTPLLNRSLSSQLASPGSYRVEEESLVYEVGARSFRAGFAADAAPRCIIPFGPAQSRRVHDFNALSCSDPEWARDWELWDLDVRNVNVGLVEDKIERAMRDAHTNYLVLDQRARKVVLALPPELPHPFVAAILAIVFNSFQPSSVQLWGTPVLCAVSAGLRSALVVDVGWHETTVSAVYEYREVLHRRSARAAKALTRRMADTLRRHSSASEPISFDAAEGAVSRLAWCRSEAAQDIGVATPVSLPVGTESPLQVPFQTLSEPAEDVFFSSSVPVEQTDDHDLPVHLLMYRCLLALPMDVRAICISRIVITGGASDMPGFKPRVLKEMEQLVKNKGWDPVMNYGSAAEKRLQSVTLPARDKPPDAGTSADQRSARDEPQVLDDITDKFLRESMKRGPTVQGVVRGVETLGAWAGASLVASLKVDAAFEIKRDDFLRNGLASLGNAF